MPPTHFTTSDPLSDADLRAAPVRWPRPSQLQRPPGWTPSTVTDAAEALGLDTVGALLEHLPRDTGEARTIATLQPEEVATVIVEVARITSRPVRRRGMKPLVEAIVRDQTGVMQATFFNQPWLERQYVPGTRLVLAGKYQGGNRFRVNSHARTEELSAVEGEAVMQYPATKGITSTQIAAMVREQRPAIDDVVEPLPGRLRAAEGLPDRIGALQAAHFGDTEGGRRRLAFEELLVEQLVQLRLRAERRREEHAAALTEPRSLSDRWRASLPFTLTGDQATALDEVDADLARDRPMQRLLMGEVGSGKTVVALHAMLRAIEHGGQAALMAPTEVLAEQHFVTLQSLLDDALVPVALLTGSTPAKRRREVLGRLADGSLGLVVGTHALIEDAVAFADLTVVIVDEQHRFGVRQRAALDAKARPGFAPHVLHMTATPIPRTLRLTGFGALDVTVLRGLPRGRKPITTHVCSTDRERARAYERIREELDAGRQAYVVCPLVAESEALQARAATEEHKRLQEGELRDYEVVLVHGQLKPAEKAAAMERFASGAAHVLVATTVIEVGIDVPNATVIVIEDAERYGISQLHQLRGRVGRGEHRSVCLLFGPKESERLRALAEHTDGFALAEIDLELRGEGELFGTRQSGLARHRFARLPEDGELLERAHVRALRLLDEDPALGSPELALLVRDVVRLERAPVAA